MSKDLGQALKSLRKQSELTQRQVADVLHIDRSTYAYYESGTTEPDLKSLTKLAQIFNVPAVMLLPDKDGKTPVSLSDVTAGEEKKKSSLKEENVLDLRDEKIYSITKDERSMLILYRTLTPEQKKKFVGFAQKLNQEQE